MENIHKREAWNKGNLVGQKPPLKPKDIWAIRIYLQNAHAVRDLAMFNLAIDSKLRGCDLVSLRVRDITHGNQVLSRAMVIQRKTQRPVQFELTEPTRVAVSAWLEKSRLRSDQFLFPSRVARSPHVSTRQYARIVHHWAESAGSRTKVAISSECLWRGLLSDPWASFRKGGSSRRVPRLRLDTLTGSHRRRSAR